MLTIRKFRASDAQAVSDLIRVTMKRSNAQDYPPERLQPLMDYFSPTKVEQLNLDRCCLVAEQEHTIVGTAAIEGVNICTFFVHPDHQAKGIGSRLLAAIETAASSLGLNCLIVEASLTGVRFYERKGYSRTGRTIAGIAGSQIEIEKRWDNAEGRC